MAERLTPEQVRRALEGYYVDVSQRYDAPILRRLLDSGFVEKAMACGEAWAALDLSDRLGTMDGLTAAYLRLQSSEKESEPSRIWIERAVAAEDKYGGPCDPPKEKL